MANNGFRFSCSRFGCIWAVVLCISILPARGWCDSGDRPSAFLDSAARIDLSVTVAVDPASLAGHIAVVCGGSPDPVVRIEAAGSSGVESPPADPDQIELAGSFQPALGGEAWQTNDRRTRMCEHGPGVFELVVRIPAGSYEYKVTRGGTWAQNWGAGFSPGGGNIALNVPRTSLVRFVVDFNRRLILNSADDPNQVRPPTQTDSSHGASQAVSDTHPTRYLQLDLARPLGPTDIVRPMTVQMDGITIPVYARDVLSDAAYVYHGNDLDNIALVHEGGRRNSTVGTHAPGAVRCLEYDGPRQPERRVLPVPLFLVRQRAHGSRSVWTRGRCETAPVDGDRSEAN